MNESLLFDVHDVGVRIGAADPRLTNLIRANFHHFISGEIDACDIDIEISGYWSAQKVPSFGPPKPSMMKRLSSELFWDQGNLYWLSPRIRTKVAFDGSVLTVKGDYVERIDHTLRRTLLRKQSIQYQNYQTLMRYAVHYPLFWLLERAKGIGVLHASAVEKTGRSLIFTGLNGSGKSTLAAYFWQRLGYKLLSDNFLLYDSQTLYGFPEVVRTPKKLINSEDIIYTLPTPVFKKYQAVLSPRLISMKAEPDAIFFTTIGSKTRLTPITVESMLQWLARITHFLGELTHNTYMEFFDPPNRPDALRPFDAHQEIWRNLQILLRNIPCYELEIGYGEPTESTVERVLNLVHTEIE